jgi:hypothetical protein
MTDSSAAHQVASHPSDAECDVWWGPDGIDALIWADQVPYESASLEAEAEAVPSGGGAV